MKQEYNAIGVMSGSSLDGLDIAYCQFSYQDKWNFNIVHAETIPYLENWNNKLKNAPMLSAEELTQLDINYGRLIGKNVRSFIQKHNITPSIIASHGHTVFHNPDMGYTLQIGNGQAIAKESKITTINDFRTGDIILGGQGAPLVPIGDKLLFPDYKYCVNLGGIANISIKKDKSIIAYDICPANQLLNYLSNQFGKSMDKNGETASLGKLDIVLFDELNQQSYFSSPTPKSMSNQLVQNTFIPILDNSQSPIQDKLYTVCKHIAWQISNSIDKNRDKKILLTGGGAHNTFLINAIKMETNIDVIIPHKIIIDYKEALIFAFMGILRKLNKINIFSSVTGAIKDSSQGVLHNITQ